MIFPNIASDDKPDFDFSRFGMAPVYSDHNVKKSKKFKVNMYKVVYRCCDDFIDVFLPWYLLGVFHYIMKLNHFVLVYKSVVK